MLWVGVIISLYINRVLKQYYAYIFYIYTRLSQIFNLIVMHSNKSRSWSQQEDQELDQIVKKYTQNNQKISWNQIVYIIKGRNPNFSKNGKQCRQRWSNHLNPLVNRTDQWRKQENQILLRLHNTLGNKWSQISKQLTGRTDNTIKNHFNSIMRKGFRKLNQYIKNVKRKQLLVKTINNEILTKILTICQGKKDQKYQFSLQTKSLAQDIKNIIALIALDGSDESSYNIQNKQLLYQQICEFKRNCKRKKQKKSLSKSQDQSSYYFYNQTNKQKNLKKQQRKIQSQQDIGRQKQTKKHIMTEKQSANQKDQSFQLLKKPLNQPNHSIENSNKKNENKQIEQIELIKQDKQQNLQNKSGQLGYGFLSTSRLLSSFPSFIQTKSNNSSSIFNFKPNAGYIQFHNDQQINQCPTPSFLNQIQDVTYGKKAQDKNFKGEVNFNQINFPPPDLTSLFKYGDLGSDPRYPGFQITFPQPFLTPPMHQVNQSIFGSNFHNSSSGFSLFNRQSTTSKQFSQAQLKNTNEASNNIQSNYCKISQMPISKSTNL